MSWMVRRRSWWTSSWIRATISGVVQLVFLPVCSSSPTDKRQVLNRVCHWNTYVRLKIWSPKACWIIMMFSVALFPRLAQNLMHTSCSFLWYILKIATGHVHDSTPNKRVWKLSTSTQLRVTWHTDSLDMVVLPSSGASRYHNCCIYGGISPEYFG
jgi:hypothetical protein